MWRYVQSLARSWMQSVNLSDLRGFSRLNISLDTCFIFFHSLLALNSRTCCCTLTQAKKTHTHRQASGYACVRTTTNASRRCLWHLLPCPVCLSLSPRCRLSIPFSLSLFLSPLLSFFLSLSLSLSLYSLLQAFAPRKTIQYNSIKSVARCVSRVQVTQSPPEPVANGDVSSRFKGQATSNLQKEAPVTVAGGPGVSGVAVKWAVVVEKSTLSLRHGRTHRHQQQQQQLHHPTSASSVRMRCSAGGCSCYRYEHDDSHRCHHSRPLLPPPPPLLAEQQAASARLIEARKYMLLLLASR